ncbi:MAG: hypothetical protein ABR520_04515 [Mycobacteriales bacterium]
MAALTRSRRVRVLALLAAAAGATALTAPASLAARRTPKLGFSASVPVDPQRDEAEPLVHIDHAGNLYTCGPTGFTTGADYAQVSTDGGDQFHLLGTPPRGQLAQRGGGDCGLATSPVKNAKGYHQLAYIGLADTDFSTAASSNGGASFGATGTTCSGVTDRQWAVAIDDRTVFMTYNDVAGGAVVQKSTDGGLTYNGYGPCGANKKTVTANDDFPGPMNADMNTRHNRTHPDKPLIYFGWNGGSKVYLALSQDAGDTWTSCVAATADGDPTNGFVTVDHDTAGNLYLAYGTKGSKGNFHTYLTTLPVAKIRNCTKESDNPGWSAPRRVDSAPVGTLVFPWLAAGGAPGRVAIAYYGTTAVGKADATTFKGAWDVYVAQSLNALSRKPSFTQVKATTHPLHYDQICLSGLGCTTGSLPVVGAGADRSLADFFSIAYHPKTKRLVIVYDQTYKKPGDKEGSVAIAHVIVQNSGPSNGGGNVKPGRATVLKAASDRTGDAQAPYSISAESLPVEPPPAARTNRPALDLQSVKVEPERDLATGERVADGGFTVTMKVANLNDASLQSAAADLSSSSLIWAFRWVNGYRAVAASVHWDPARGFAGGYDDFTAASVSCIGTSDKCQVYPGATPIQWKVDQDAGVIQLSVPRSVLRELYGPTTKGQRPVERPAARPGASRFYDATAFTIADPSLPEASGFLVGVDNTPAFDFVLPR